MDVLAPIADAERATVVLGVNVDDLGDHRPGQRAAAEGGAAFPLVAAGFTKADVRAASRAARPADVGQAGGRLPGQPHPLRHRGDGAVLSTVERAEAALQRARLRRRCASATTATRRGSRSTLADLRRVVEPARPIVDAVRAVGYRYVTLDLEGFRSGNLNGSPTAEGYGRRP